MRLNRDEAARQVGLACQGSAKSAQDIPTSVILYLHSVLGQTPLDGYHTRVFDKSGNFDREDVGVYD